MREEAWREGREREREREREGEKKENRRMTPPSGSEDTGRESDRKELRGKPRTYT
jgi:hypothetical protein